jgi:hypothetical protein
MLGLISLKLLSTNLATNGKAAMTRGTIMATVPILVPKMSSVRGNAIIIRMRKGIDLKRFII